MVRKLRIKYLPNKGIWTAAYYPFKQTDPEMLNQKSISQKRLTQNRFDTNCNIFAIKLDYGDYRCTLRNKIVDKQSTWTFYWL